jgi:hypothetical protein
MKGSELEHEGTEAARIAQLKQERDYHLAHSRNLELELRRVSVASARIRELERLLAGAESRLRRVSVMHTAKWLILEPDVAFRRIYRRLRDRVLWPIRERVRVYRLRHRRFGA